MTFAPDSIGAQSAWLDVAWHNTGGPVGVQQVPITATSTGIVQTDLLIKGKGAGVVGEGVLSTTGTNQVVKSKSKPGRKAVFQFTVQNDGTVKDSFLVHGASKKRGFSLTYLLDGPAPVDITAAITGGGYLLPGVTAGGTRVIRLVVKLKDNVKVGVVQSWLVGVTSMTDPSKRDAVLAKVKVVKP